MLPPLVMASCSSSSSRSWSYDVFPSFSGEDVRKTFLSHFLRELERNSIVAFKDNEMQRSQSIAPELVQAIRDSRIAVVVFSKNYASSSWCLNELLEILQCNEELGQLVIPIFYGLDPTHLRKQTGDFGEAFRKTCQNQTHEVEDQWKQALTNVANILGYHSKNCDSEAAMIEEISSDILDKLAIAASSNEFEDFVGIKDHIAEVILLMNLESKEVKMVGIWGTSGIGKTTIARALFCNISNQFQRSVFIDRAFISKSMEVYGRANPVDYNMKLRLRMNFLSEILDRKNMKIGAMEERLKHQKVLIVIDDLDDQYVLDALAGQTKWFGSGSRIIVVTTDKHLLKAHGIDSIYEVGLPSDEQALEMFCRSAFRQDSPPDGLMEFASEVVERAGSLPLGLDVLGSSLRGLNKEDCLNMLPRLRRSLDGKIEETLRVGYDGLLREDKAIFRHIACLFNHVDVKDIKLFLADSELDVDIGLKNLVNKSLIQVRWGKVEMHHLLQEMGRNTVRLQSIKKPQKREFLVDSKDICDVLRENIGTPKLLGMSLNIDDTDALQIHESAFKGMRNLRFLEVHSNKVKFGNGDKLKLPKSFDCLPPKLKLLCWSGYPMRSMPSTFCTERLVKLKMRNSKLEKLWEGVMSLTCLIEMDLCGSHDLKEIPDLTTATNLETLSLQSCRSLVELPSSIRNLNKLIKLDMQFCKKLESLPTGINLKSLDHVNLSFCSQLRTFPQISTNISFLFLEETRVVEFPTNLRLENLVKLHMSKVTIKKQWKGVQLLTPFMPMLSPTLTELYLSNIRSLVELPTSFRNLNNLRDLKISRCMNLEALPTGINLKSLDTLNLTRCSRLTTFPNISTNISDLDLSYTSIEEVPWWVETFSKLKYLTMESCSKLEYVHLNISKLLHLEAVDFSHCEALKGADLSGQTSSGVKMEACKNIDTVSEESSSLLPDKFIPKIGFVNCFKFNQDVLFQQLSVAFKSMMFLGEAVPSYFTHHTTESSLTIPLLDTSLTQTFFTFKVCAVVVFDSLSKTGPSGLNIRVKCRFKGICGNIFDSSSEAHSFRTLEKDSRLFMFDCCVPLNKDNSLVAHHVDMQIQISCWQEDSTFRLTGWGIRLFENCSSPENGLTDMVSDGCHKSELGEECGGSDVEMEKTNKLVQVCIKHEIEQGEKCGGSDAEMKGSNKAVEVCIKDETECGDNIVERRERRKGMGMIIQGRLLFKKLLNCYATKPHDT
ncbi:hypothetical protein Bca4012_057172 [Brassica carinata]|uniref:ADP-ribosyl cyclase/cyclic ADP-ribose hydrolase n=1 Tax=Brassica carinata TaxID=52824 RepID=A0A8X8B578_BRACI|nr:hypothetical protein Bca52824_015225 [Brassica carinata]